MSATSQDPAPREVLPGAEPFSAPGGPAGALLLHGFTGSPHSVRGVAAALAGAGLAVEAPLLPGHGTRMEDLLRTGWDDWFAAVERSWHGLRSRCERVAVFGLSMGGSLALALAAAHPEVAGLALVNPFVDPPADSFRDLLRGLLDSGSDVIPGIAGDIADPDAVEVAYPGTPIAPLLSLSEALARLVSRLGDITCPLLVMTSRRDNVVPPVSSDVLAERVAGPVERVPLENSLHVATLDHDREEIERRTVAFALKVTAVPPVG
ncbi:MAG TPA: alpha/beta fold hydrolase [Acidimicrobiales bacterium]|nr:alpha/beta fold hydrolase [Acidimicrobiales bacterium]